MAAVHSMALHRLGLPPAAPWQGRNGICCLAPGGPSHLQGTIEMLLYPVVMPFLEREAIRWKPKVSISTCQGDRKLLCTNMLHWSCRVQSGEHLEKFTQNVILRQNLRASIKCNTEASIKHSHFSKKTVLLNCWGRRHSRNCYDVMSCHRVSNQVSNTLYSRQ